MTKLGTVEGIYNLDNEAHYNVIRFIDKAIMAIQYNVDSAKCYESDKEEQKIVIIGDNRIDMYRLIRESIREIK